MKSVIVSRLALSVVMVIGCYLSTAAQTTVRGMIIDDLGSSLPGATVMVKEQSGKGTITDLDGKFELKVESDTPFTLVVSYISFQPVERVVEPAQGEVVVVDVKLVPESFAIEEVVIQAKADKSKDYFMEKIKQRSATAIDYISKQTIKNTGDSDVSGAIKRVTGVSSVDGFITVRGLADRYNLSTIDGLRIPTLDPFTNNIDLDIFPTGLIDNLVITKTSNPQLPADWSGAFLSIETQDYPDKLNVSISTSFGYNEQASLQEIVSSEKSDTDWLGYDNGFRDIGDGVSTDLDGFPRFFQGYGSIYQQLVTLGLGDFLTDFGITSGTTIARGSDLHKLALVELGLLTYGQFSDAQAVDGAIQEFESLGGLQDQAFEELNQPLEEVGESFDNTWFVRRRTAPINYSQSVTIGNQVDLFGKPMGYLVGLRYYSRVRYDPNSRWGRSGVPVDFVLNSDTPVDTLLDNGDYDQIASRERNGWSALVKWSYKPSKNHSVSLMFMPNLLGENRARRFTGIAAADTDALLEGGDDQIYDESRQLVYQYHSQHRIPSLDLTISLDGSYTDGQKNTLDFKSIQYRQRTDIWEFDNAATPARIFRFLDEDLLDSRLLLERPVRMASGLKAQASAGVGYQWNERGFQQVFYRLNGVQNELLDSDPNNFGDVLTLDRFTINADNADLFYSLEGAADNSTDIGIKKVYSGFGQLDIELSRRLRAIGGIRIEQTDMIWDIREFYDQDIPADDDRRSSFNPSTVESTDVLPSLNLVYRLRADETMPINLRAAYFRSLARPGLREISPIPLLDFFLRDFVRGNDSLQIVDVHNFDLRLESYFQSGDNVSLSFFYKDITNHIELVFAAGGFTWINAPESYAFGVELEGRKRLTNKLSVAGNLTWIDSETRFVQPSLVAGGEDIVDERPMFGQAPWIANGILTYQADSLGLTVSASYNVQGRKLAVVQRAEAVQADVYELPRNLLDLKVSKRFGDHFSVSIGVRDLLAAPIRRTYVFDEGYEVDFDRFTFGRTYNLGFNYRL